MIGHSFSLKEKTATKRLLLCLGIFLFYVITGCSNNSGDSTYTSNIFYLDASYTGGQNNGSPQHPYTSIAQCLNRAREANADTINIAVGNYEITETLNLVEGISLYGGWTNSSGTWTRNAFATSENRSTFLTKISHTGTVEGESMTPASTILADNSITSSTIIEGVTICGPDGKYTAALFANEGSPIIRFNSINGGNASNENYVIFAKGDDASAALISDNLIDGGSSPIATTGIRFLNYTIIRNNTINGGDGSNSSTGITATGGSSATKISLIEKNVINGGTGSTSTGIRGGGNQTMIRNNIIRGGSGSTSSTGVFNGSCIYNNTIDGGTGTESYGIYQDFIPNPLYGDFRNNIIFCTQNSTNSNLRYGIFAEHNSNEAMHLENNNIFDCPTALYKSLGNIPTNPSATDDFTYTTIADVNNHVFASGNVSLDPAFTDRANGDFHIGTSTDASITEGGQNLSAANDFNGENVADDFGGSSRTVPYSMGAYEYD